MDGMFSIQVLTRALESWGLQVISLESEEARAFKAAPTTAEAFICNLHEHWFTLRRVTNGEWWNFNSLFPAPQPLSTFYLQAFLDTLQGEGWTIFVVAGKLPVAQPGGLEQQHNATGRWWSPDEARAATDEAERARKRGRVTAALEMALDRAGQQGGQLQLRSRAAQGAAAGPSNTGAYGNDDGGDVSGSGDDEDADLMAAIAASLETHQPTTTASGAAAGGAADEARPGSLLPASAQAQGQGQGPRPPAVGGGHDLYGEDDDPELAMAIAASLADSVGAAAAAVPVAEGDGAGGGVGDTAKATSEPELGPEPDAGEGVVEVAFRLPTGARCSRRFALSNPSSHLFAFLGPLLGMPTGQVALSSTFPKKELERSATVTLSDLGLSNRTLLVAEAKR